MSERFLPLHKRLVERRPWVLMGRDSFYHNYPPFSSLAFPRSWMRTNMLLFAFSVLESRCALTTRSSRTWEFWLQDVSIPSNSAYQKHGACRRWKSCVSRRKNWLLLITHPDILYCVIPKLSFIFTWYLGRDFICFELCEDRRPETACPTGSFIG